MKPINGNILIRREESDDKTKGGIYLPSKSEKREAKIIAQCATLTDAEFVEGDRVLVAQFGMEDVYGQKATYLTKADKIEAIIHADKDGDYLTPVADRVVVMLDPQKEESEGGIILSAKQVTDSEWGEVVSTGRGCEALEEGDRVHVHPTRGLHIMLEGKDYIVLKESRIECVDKSQTP